MSQEAGAREHISALRAAHERLVSLVADLDEPGLLAPSYDREWCVGQVLSHLGSQTEIVDAFLDAALDGTPAPDGDDFGPVWEVWDAKRPMQWRDDWRSTSERHLQRLEAIDDRTADAFALSMFGQELHLEGFVRMRLTETAMHTWDIEVVRDPAATVIRCAVPLVLDHLDEVVARLATGEGARFTVRVGTHDPVRDLVVEVADPVVLRDAEPDDSYDGSLDLPAEAFLRLTMGRLDVDHTPEHSQSGSRGLVDLRAVFLGV